jgi:hypothetical protein
MLVIRVELHSAISGEISEIARMRLYNDGDGTRTRGNYVGEVFRGRNFEALDKTTVHRRGEIKNWPRLDRHVWNLVAAMLESMGYGK